MEVQFKITGAEQIAKRLKSLADEKGMKKVARAGARKGMTVVRDAARAGARALDDPQSAANIAKNIVVQESARAGREEGGIVMRVGVRGGANTRSKADVGGLSGGDTRHWRYIEFGTQDTPAHPFMRRALDANVQRVTDAVVDAMSKGLDKAGV